MLIAATMATVMLGAAPTQPDPDKTPGLWRPITVEEICATKWGADRRAVTAHMKIVVFMRYGFSGNDDDRCTPPAGHHQRCEIDHRSPRELGGADDVSNLWVEAYSGPWNAHDKDRLENWAHARVCDGSLTLDDARAMFDGNWHDGYVKAFGGPPISAKEDPK